jgi:hypothetical protein
MQDDDVYRRLRPPPSAEARAKMSAASRARTHSPQTKAAISEKMQRYHDRRLRNDANCPSALMVGEQTTFAVDSSRVLRPLPR